MKRNKGITLIALVITIIVLLILTGVAISMLSGENGILKRVVEAKTKTEDAQEEEETALIDMELNAHFIEKNLKYKCAYGYITGLTEGEEVSKLQTALPSNYEVKAEDGTDNFKGIDKTTNKPIVSTGLSIVKDGKTVARTVLFGDVNCSGVIDEGDFTDANYFVVDYNEEQQKKLYKKHQLVAMNINGDNCVDKNDLEGLSLHLAKTNPINQNQYAKNPNKLIYTNKEKVIEEYMNKLSDDFKNNTEYSFEKEDTEYKLKVASGGELAKQKRQELVAMLPKGTFIEVEDTGYSIIYTIKYKDNFLGEVKIAIYEYNYE